MAATQKHKRQQPIIMYRVVFRTYPVDMHLFATYEKAVAMLGISSGKIVKVEVHEVETVFYQP